MDTQQNSNYGLILHISCVVFETCFAFFWLINSILFQAKHVISSNLL